MSPITYILWPNPPALNYDNTRILMLFFACFLLILIAIFIRSWRIRSSNSVAKRLSRSWTRALIWFGIIGIIMVVSRVEQISYLSMRLWWVVWALSLIFYLLFQTRSFRLRYYQKIITKTEADPRERYLPKRKRK